MDNKQLVNKFTAAIEKAFSRKTGKIEDQIDFNKKYQHLFKEEYETAIKIINAVKDADTLAELMSAYLTLYARYYSNKNNIHFDRSDQTYYELYDRSRRVSMDKRDLFEQWAGFLDPSPETDSYNSFKKRFKELSPTYQTKITASIKDEREKRSQSKSLLDILREEYLKQNRRAPKNNNDLYDFNPAPSEVLKGSLEKQLDELQKRWVTCAVENTPENRKALHASMDQYQMYLDGVLKHGPLKAFQVIKYLQDRIKTKRENMGTWTRRIDGDHSELMCELYTIACLQLLVWGSGTKLHKRNRFGFTKEEQDYFLRYLRDIPYLYISNLENRFASQLDDVAALFDQSKAFLDLILLTKNQVKYATLVDLKETLRIQKMWTDINELTTRLKSEDEAGMKKLLSDAKNLETLKKLLEIVETEVPIGQQGPNLGKGFAHVGSSPGVHEMFGEISIVYIDPKYPNNFYIEYAGLKPNLFLVHTDYITRKLYASRITEIYRSTIGMVYVSRFMFLAMGFFPVLVEEGIAGLVYEVFIYYASTKAEELAEKVDPIFGKIVGFATMLFAPRPNFKPKLVGLATEQSVRVLSVEGVQVNRSFEEILESAKAEGKLIGDLQRGTMKGALAKARDVIRDKVMQLRELELGKVLEGIAPSEALVTNEGITLRVSQGEKGIGARGAGTATRAETSLQNSAVFKLLQEYYPLLDRYELNLLKKEVDGILRDLRIGQLKYSEAQKEILNLLNGAKEATGEYAADAAVLSNFEVLEVISIPRRKNDVPMLDRIYKVRDHKTGNIDYLLAEIKGGEKTRLGFVTKKTYSYKNNKLTITVVPDQWVQQASGEWYYQKIIEIYESGNKKLAQKLFEAAKSGKVQTAIIKSGKEMVPNIKFNTDDVIAWFVGKKLPYD